MVRTPVSGSPLVAVRLVLLGPGVVVQSLRHEVQRQSVFIPGGFLDFGSFVLEPDLDLGLVEAQLPGQGLTPLLRQVPVPLKLRLQPLQLLRCEGRAGPLVLRAGGQGLLWFAGSGPLRCKVQLIFLIFKNHRCFIKV